MNIVLNVLDNLALGLLLLTHCLPVRAISTWFAISWLRWLVSPNWRVLRIVMVSRRASSSNTWESLRVRIVVPSVQVHIRASLLRVLSSFAGRIQTRIVRTLLRIAALGVLLRILLVMLSLLLVMLLFGFVGGLLLKGHNLRLTLAWWDQRGVQETQLLSQMLLS